MRFVLAVLLALLLLTPAAYAQGPDEELRVVEAIAGVLKDMGQPDDARELRQRYTDKLLTFGPTQSGDNAEAQPGTQLIRFHSKVFVQMLGRNGVNDREAINWAGTYLHERVHVGQSRMSWMGAIWQEIFGQGNVSETKAWTVQTQAYLDWYYGVATQLKQPGLTLAEQVRLSQRLSYLGDLLQRVQADYGSLGYAPLRLDTPAGPMRLAEVLEDIAAATVAADRLVAAEGLTVQILPAFRNVAVGEAVSFSAKPKGGTPVSRGPRNEPLYQSFQWRLDGRVIGQGRSVTFTAQKNAALEVEVVDGANRKATGRAQVRVSQAQALTVVVAPATVKVAPGKLFRVAARAQGGRPPYSYTWQRDGKPTPVKSAGLKGTSQKDSLLVVEVRDGAGNTSKASCQIQVVAPLTVSLPARIQVAKGARFTLRPQVTGGRAPYTFRWYRNNGLIKHSGSEATGTAKEAMTIRVDVVDATGQTQAGTCQVQVGAAAVNTPSPPPPPPPAAEARYTLHLTVPVDPEDAYLSGEIALGEKAEMRSQVNVVVRGNGLFGADGQGQKLGTAQNGRVSFRITSADGQVLECQGSLGPSGGSGSTKGRYGAGTWKLTPR